MVRFPSEGEQGTGPGPDEIAPVASLADRRSRRAAARPLVEPPAPVEEPPAPQVEQTHPARGRSVTEVDGIVTIGAAVDASEAGRALAAQERIAEARRVLAEAEAQAARGSGDPVAAFPETPPTEDDSTDDTTPAAWRAEQERAERARAKAEQDEAYRQDMIRLEEDRVEDERREAEAEEERAAERTPERQRRRADNVLANRLRGRGLSLAEAREVLDGAEIDPDIAEETLARYVSLQYIDEAALAEQILHTHLDRKGLGRRSVEMEMRRRKLDPLVIEEAMAEQPDDELARATEVAMKRVGQLSSYDDETAERRLTSFLMRRGYGGGVVRDAAKAALATRRGSSRVRFR
ncbi:regulatory protein RecX [Clavibacter michiganensis]|uniref:regulatory protein RecX n=1 Tax=Clavibacter michiganensis TaxID=28447 RepID=UPI001D681035|nr:regulatory protein RecX [Clavibacter michiganensis]MBP2458726.1 regulatory protein [Clavibacter michiganensis]MDQ0411298.1 regulatory protein [Clavibacter michiganensis]